MNQQQRPSLYTIQYATHDAVVKRFLERASLYKVLGWMQLAACALSAAVGIFDRSIPAAIAAALGGTTAAFFFIAHSGHQKSAWLRTLEVRLDDLRNPSGESSEPRDSEDVPVA